MQNNVNSNISWYEGHIITSLGKILRFSQFYVRNIWQEVRWWHHQLTHYITLIIFLQSRLYIEYTQYLCVLILHLKLCLFRIETMCLFRQTFSLSSILTFAPCIGGIWIQKQHYTARLISWTHMINRHTNLILCKFI